MSDIVADQAPSPGRDFDLVVERIGVDLQAGRQPRLADIKIAAKQDGVDDDHEISAVVAMCGLFIGRDLNQLVQYTGYPIQQVRLRIDRMRWNGIWGQEGMAVDWLEDEIGLSFICDVLVAQGECRRDNDHCYIRIPSGQCWPLLPSVDDKKPRTWTPWAITKALMEQHLFELDAAVEIAYRGYLNLHPDEGGRNWASTGQMKYWMHQTQHVPLIPDSLASIHKAYHDRQKATRTVEAGQ